MFKSSLQITIFSVLGIGITFLIQVLLTHAFGAGQQRDAYFAALTIPSYLTILFSGSIGVMLIPAFVKHMQSKNLADELRFASAIFNLTWAGLAIVVIAGYLLSEQIMDLMIPDSTSEFFQLAVQLFRILLLGSFFSTSAMLLSAVSQAKNLFISTSLIPIITNVLTLFFVVFFTEQVGIKAVAYGNLVGSMLSLTVVLLLTLRLYKFQWRLSFRHHAVVSVLRASFPLLATGIFFRSTTVVERFLAARLPEGGLTYLGSANQIVLMVSSVVTGGIATSSFPILIKHWQRGNKQLLQTGFKRLIMVILMVVLPLTVIFLVNGVSILSVIFEHGAFSAHDTIALYHTMAVLMGLLLFTCLGSVVSKMLYLSNNTIAGSLIAATEIVCYFVVSMLLINELGYIALALALSISSGLNILLSLMFIRARIFSFAWRTVMLPGGTLIFSTICIAALAHWVNFMILPELGSLLRIVISTILILLSFLYLFSVVLKVPDLNNLLVNLKYGLSLKQRSKKRNL